MTLVGIMKSSHTNSEVREATKGLGICSRAPPLPIW